MFSKTVGKRSSFQIWIWQSKGIWILRKSVQIKTKFWLILWTNLETNQRRTCIVWPWVKWPTRKDWRVCALQQATYRLSSTTTSLVLKHNMKLPKSCSFSILTQVCSHLRVALCWPLRLSTVFSGPFITFHFDHLDQIDQLDNLDLSLYFFCL